MVSERFEVYEHFVGFYQVESTEAEKVYGVNTDMHIQLNLAVSKVCGQCYVRMMVLCLMQNLVLWQGYLQLNLFTNFYGHTQIFLVLTQDVLDTTHEITKLIKKAPHLDAIFKYPKEKMLMIPRN